MWEEEKHPRDNDGKFAEKGNAGNNKKYTDRQVELARAKLYKSVMAIKKNSQLSKVERRKLHDKIVEVQHGGWYKPTAEGNKLVTIEHNNKHSLVVYSGGLGDYSVKKVVKVTDRNIDKISDYMDILRELF